MNVIQGLADQCIGDVAVYESAKHFRHARKKARKEMFSAKLKKENDGLLSLSDVCNVVKTTGEHYLGVKSIPVERIVGSEDRAGDFTRSFMPKSAALQHRWESIDAAFFNGIDLPPIKVIELGGVYFVRDGNHRVSVARSKKSSRCLDAEIIHLQSDIALEPGMSADEIGELAQAGAV